jgi:hypothetical protein
MDVGLGNIWSLAMNFSLFFALDYEYPWCGDSGNILDSCDDLFVDLCGDILISL